MAFFKKVDITSAATVTLTIEFCTAVTGSWSCTSYPVFSQNVDHPTLGRYSANTPLKTISGSPPSASTVAKNNPGVSLTSGDIKVLFTYGGSFSESPNEYSGGSPRRYFYLVHLSSISGSLPSEWDSSLPSSSDAICWGSVNVGRAGGGGAGAPGGPECEPSATTSGGGAGTAF